MGINEKIGVMDRKKVFRLKTVDFRLKKKR